MEIILLTILLIHFIADFMLQKHWMAMNKWNNIRALLSHTSVYSLCWLALYPFLGLNTGIFVCITFFAHTLTDYFTSKWVHKLFDRKDYHNGFVIIGLDQMLHYIQLYLTFKLLV